MSESSPLEVHVLASGSKGNCTVIKKGNSVILHDVGISCRRIVNGLKELHIDMAQVEGIFISHEHSDHIAGLQQLLNDLIFLCTRNRGRGVKYKTSSSYQRIN